MNLEFQTIVERYSASLYRLAYSFLGSRQDAEDVLQETFLRFLRMAPEFDEERQLHAWLRTVTANLCRDLLRSPWRRRTLPLEEAVAMPDTTADPELESALSQLKPKDRAIVYLFYYEQCSSAEIAQTLRMSDSAVRSRLTRAEALTMLWRWTNCTFPRIIDDGGEGIPIG